MRAEDAGARTWLSAAIAGWAVCVWILAMFGMGGSIDRLEEDPSLVQPLPALGAPAPERLGPLPQYGDVAARPLFTDNRRPQPFVIDPAAGPGEGGGGFDYVLTSVLRTPQVQLVILQPAEGGEPVRVRQGSAPEGAPGWVLQSVEARRAVFAGPEGERTLELRVFDGMGGEAPTPFAPRDATASAAGPSPSPSPSPPATAAPPDGRPAPAARAEPTGAAAEPLVADAPDAAAQRQAEQEQVEMIRRRIEERRARLRADEMATRRPPRADPNTN